MAQTVKSLPAVQETWVWSFGQEDSLEEERATRSSILAWRIPQTEEPGGLQSMGSQRVEHITLSLSYFHFNWIPPQFYFKISQSIGKYPFRLKDHIHLQFTFLIWEVTFYDSNTPRASESGVLSWMLFKAAFLNVKMISGFLLNLPANLPIPIWKARFPFLRNS